MPSCRVALSFLCLAACASGLENENLVDGATIDAPMFEFPDAPNVPRPDAFHLPDAAAPQDFGGPCDDGSGCKEGVCLLGDTGGYCSKICTAGTCPPGYGCLGVTGAVEPGHVTFVCVKDFTLLCSPCGSTTECGVDGDNLCIAEATGGSFCARDCQAVTCPDGYVCQNVGAGDAGVGKMQCVPMSGACDCGAATQGMTKGCPLTTPFGTSCQGVRTCQGVSGWGDCVPPSATDVPDSNFADENCDGIDGTVSDGVFVVTPPNGGADTEDCGPSRLNPCATISRGAQHAKLLGRHYVFVQAGTYDETVVMTDGVSIFGGYDASWQREDRSRPGHEVHIHGSLYGVDDQYVAIVAHDLTQPTTIGDLFIDGDNATGSSQRAGRSSYGIHADNAHLTVERVMITAARGAPGATGANGMDAPGVNATTAMNGKIGGTAGQEGGCDDSTRGAAGMPGSNSCPDHGGDNPSAAIGGVGGTEDSGCTLGVCAGGGCDCTSGTVGGNATVFVAQQYGFGGSFGVGTNANGDTICGGGGPGGDGLVTNGPGGPGGDGGGRVIGGYWFAFFGQDGGQGKNGTGGGGGGGSGGCDTGSPDTYGAGGGGGGAGGCAALSGGQGGEGGGGSFGLFAVGSTVRVRNVTIIQADAARGGDGGVGGRGQDGGAGGPGGPVVPGGSARDGGKGGNGAHGGHGGGGGGGAGGVSYGVFTTSDTALDLDDSNTIQENGVSGGGAGGPGASAPSSPAPGNSGSGGTAGVEGKTFVCGDPAHC